MRVALQSIIGSVKQESIVPRGNDQGTLKNMTNGKHLALGRAPSQLLE